MAWVAQRTWADGETVTASMLNVMVRDDLRFLYSPPGARASHAVDQRLDFSLGYTPLPDFGETMLDTTGTMHGQIDYGAPYLKTSFLTAPIAGRYLIGTTITFKESTVVGRHVVIGKSIASPVYIGWKTNSNAGTTSRCSMTVTTIDSLAADDSLFVVAVYDSGTPPVELNVLAQGSASPVFSAHWMGN